MGGRLRLGYPRARPEQLRGRWRPAWQAYDDRRADVLDRRVFDLDPADGGQD